MKGLLVDLVGLRNNKYRVTVEVDGSNEINKVEKFKKNNDVIKVEIKKYCCKRSLSANAYCWVLLEKIAEKIGMCKEDVYKKMLQDYGTIATDDDGSKVIFSVKADVDVSKYFRYFKFLGDSKDKTYKHYYAIKGSSEYNSQEMNKFVNGIVQECQNLNIDTLTPEEIARLSIGE